MHMCGVARVSARLRDGVARTQRRLGQCRRAVRCFGGGAVAPARSGGVLVVRGGGDRRAGSHAAPRLARLASAFARPTLPPLLLPAAAHPHRVRCCACCLPHTPALLATTWPLGTRRDRCAPCRPCTPEGERSRASWRQDVVCDTAGLAAPAHGAPALHVPLIARKEQGCFSRAALSGLAATYRCCSASTAPL